MKAFFIFTIWFCALSIASAAGLQSSENKADTVVSTSQADGTSQQAASPHDFKEADPARPSELQCLNWPLPSASQENEGDLSRERNGHTASGLNVRYEVALSDIPVKDAQFEDSLFPESDDAVDSVPSGDLSLQDTVGNPKFLNPEADGLQPGDGLLGMYHWTKWLETSLDGDMFDNHGQAPTYGGRLSSESAPVTVRDIYTVQENQPFASRISTINSLTREEFFGNGLDVRLGHGFSTQNTMEMARVSEGRFWWVEKTRFSYRVSDEPTTFVRVEYDYLTYANTGTNTWMPFHRHVIAPIVDSYFRLGQKVKFALDTRLPYIFDAAKFGFQVEGGPSIDLTSRLQIAGSYIYSLIPGSRGSSDPFGTSQAIQVNQPAWSGFGWQTYLRFRF